MESQQLNWIYRDLHVKRLYGMWQLLIASRPTRLLYGNSTVSVIHGLYGNAICCKLCRRQDGMKMHQFVYCVSTWAVNCFTKHQKVIIAFCESMSGRL